MHQTYFYKQKLTYSGLNDLADDISDNTVSHDHTEGVGGTGRKLTASGLEDSASTEIRDYTQHEPFVASGLLPQTAASLTSNITAGEGFAPDDASSRLVRVVQDSAQSHDYNSEKDTYVYLHPYQDIHGGDDGFFHFEEVDNGAGEPSQPDSTLKLAKVVTSVTEITSVEDLRNTSSIFEVQPGKIGDRLLGEGKLLANVDVVTTDQPKDLITVNITVNKENARISIFAFHSVQKLTSQGYSVFAIYVDGVSKRFTIVDGVALDWNNMSMIHVTTLSKGSHTIKTVGVAQNNTSRFTHLISAGGIPATDSSGLFVYEG